jgi:hypothetical protein
MVRHGGPRRRGKVDGSQPALLAEEPLPYYAGGDRKFSARHIVF